MKPIHCPDSGKYCRQRVKSPRAFAPGSLRIVRRGKVALIIGCPKGHWRRGRCAVGTRLQAKLYPKGSKRCRAACER